MQDFKADNPNLVAFLEERLPQLGLDGETYGMYVLGTSDDEELEEIMQLLQASSEVDDDDDEQVWIQLTKDIQEKLKLDLQLKEDKERQKREQNKALLEEQLAQAKEQLQYTEPTTTTKKTHTNSAIDDATKKALLSRFAYDQDDDEEDLEESDAPLTNREVAAMASQEQAKELRSHKVQTKKEEQQKTKEQKNSKQQLKEERRKRTQKGERKR